MPVIQSEEVCTGVRQSLLTIFTRYDGGLLGPTCFMSSHKRQPGEENVLMVFWLWSKSSNLFWGGFEAKPIFVTVRYRSRGGDYVEDISPSGHTFGNEACKQVTVTKEAN